MTFSRLVRMVGNLLFFVYWFLDEVRFIKEVKKSSRPFWTYIPIFNQPILIYSRFSIFHFFFFCNIYNVTNPIIDVYKVNNGRHYQCQSKVWAHMGIMRRRWMLKDINRQTIIWFTTQLTYKTAIHKKRWPKYSNKDNWVKPIRLRHFPYFDNRWVSRIT